MRKNRSRPALLTPVGFWHQRQFLEEFVAVRTESLHIPLWVRKGLTRATDDGLIKRPRVGWTQFEMASFFRVDKRCWLISDSFFFTSAGDMVCQPELMLDADDPAVIEQCEFLASVLGTTYRITEVPVEDSRGETSISVKFKSVGA